MDGLQVLARTLAQTMEVTLGATMDNFLTRLDAKLDDHLETPLGASGSGTGATATPTHRTTPPPTGLGTLPHGDALAAIPRVDESPREPDGDHDTDVSAALKNLLPLANSALTRPSQGVYLGDGLPPVPAKLAAKIRRGDFVEMGELLPEFWSSMRDEGSDPRKDQVPRKSRKVTDVFTWVQCFCSYVATRAPHAPEMMAELMAYMALIVRVSQDYAGLAWVRYDSGFRRQAALTGHKRWSVINPSLYTVCFTGMAAVTKRCELCFASSHTEKECAQSGDPDPGMKERLKSIESAVLAMTRKDAPQRPPATSPPRPSGEPCRKWNSTGCSYPRCRHSHTCSTCGGGHPADRCAVRTPGPPSSHHHGTPTGGKTRPY